MLQFYKGLLLTSIIFIACYGLAVADLPQQYRFSVLDNHSGLTHNQVNCFFKDSRGYIWIGTGAGLNRFDGYRLKVYRNMPTDTSSIIGNNIISIFEDPRGFVWIETTNGFSIYNHLQETFSADAAEFLKPFNLPLNEIKSIYRDREGDFWFVQNGVGLTRYSPATGKSKTITQLDGSRRTLHSNVISAMESNSMGDHWILHENGMLEKLDGKTMEIKESHAFLFQLNNGQLLDYELLVDSDDDLWVYLPATEKGVFYFNTAENRFTQIVKGSTENNLNSNLVIAAVEEMPGKIWLGTDHGGINVIDKKDLTVEYILHNSEDSKSLVHNSIYSLYKDNEGIIWIGAYKNGVNFYHRNIIRFDHFKHYASQPNSLPFDDINRFAEDHEGNIWIGTNGGGLLYYNRSEGNYITYKHEPDNKNSLSADVIVSLLVSADSNLWIGTYHGGLSKFDGQNFTHYNLSENNLFNLPDNNIWELFEASDGQIWIGTVNAGVVVVNPETGERRHYKPGTGASSLNNGYVAAIEEDADGGIWIGGSNGIDIIQPETGKIKHLLNDTANDGLTSNVIFAIHRDSKNRMWLATEEGLAVYKDQKFISKITIEEGLPHHSVLTILEDEEQNLWLGTPNGLANISFFEPGPGLSYTIRNYDEKDGLQEMVFNENAAFKASSGELLFGGPNGFNMFNPSNLLHNDKRPQVVFSDFKLFGESLKVGEELNGRVLLPKSLPFMDEITLRHNENFFSIEFAALSFFQPEKNKYKYKLLGFDQIWHFGDSKNRSITYTNLDPGSYELLVMASGNDGSWDEPGKRLKITVLAPFWKTKEAYVIYILLVVACLYFVRKIMLQRERVKFQIEQERREAKQLHELDLMKIRFLTNVSHEFRTPLSLILAPIEKLLDKNGDREHQKQFEMIHRNARRLLNLVNQLLDFRKIEVNGVRLCLSEGNIIKFIEESVRSFSDLSEKKNISLSFQTDVSELKTSFDMDKLEKVLFNLLSNAFKFTPENGEILVAVEVLDNDSASTGIKILSFKVKDSGIGIPLHMQQKVFERFFRNELPSSMVNQGSGIGLAIAKEYVRIHGGTITLKSSPGKGSCFTVSIPVKVQEVVSESNDKSTQEENLETLALVKAEVPVENGGRKDQQKNPKRPTVLLVEDNEDFRFYLKDNLGVWFNIIEARNGVEGWQHVLSEMPDLVVSDLMMPEMDGIEFCQKMKKDARTSHIPFVLLTARSANEQKLEGLNIGANDYITKPFNYEILLSRIKNLVAQQKLLHKVLEKKISAQTTDVEITSMDDKLIREAIRLVESNITDPEFSVEILSKHLGMSRANLYKKLMSLTGQSPLEFIRKIRLQRAAQYLEKSQLTVAEVAYKVGFNSPKYFTKYFKKEFNISPSLYAEEKQA